MAEWLDGVYLQIGDRVVELRRVVRYELLGFATVIPGMGAIRKKLEPFRASRPAVVDDAADLLKLQGLIRVWERSAGETPDSIVRLSSAVRAELDRRGLNAGDA